jgi:hypothetical protein
MTTCEVARKIPNAGSSGPPYHCRGSSVLLYPDIRIALTRNSSGIRFWRAMLPKRSDTLYGAVLKLVKPNLAIVLVVPMVEKVKG